MEDTIKKPTFEVRDDQTQVGTIRYLMAYERPFRLVAVIMVNVHAVAPGESQWQWKGHAFIYCNGNMDTEYHRDYEFLEDATADIEEWFIDYVGLGPTPTIGRKQ